MAHKCNRKQLEQIGQIDKLDEVLKEMIEIKMQIEILRLLPQLAKLLEDRQF